MGQLDIDPGQEWDSAVEAAVTRSPRMLLILSPASVQSRNVRNEIAFALDERKTIIPVLYQDCTVPLQLCRIQQIDFRTDDARGLKVLIRVLGVEQPAATSATVPAPTPPIDSRTASDAEEHAAAQARAERAEREFKAAAEKARQEECEHQRIDAQPVFGASWADSIKRKKIFLIAAATATAALLLAIALYNASSARPELNHPTGAGAPWLRARTGSGWPRGVRTVRRRSGARRAGRNC